MTIEHVREEPVVEQCADLDGRALFDTAGEPGREVVENYDVDPVGLKRADDMCADIAGTTSDKPGHLATVIGMVLAPIPHRPVHSMGCLGEGAVRRLRDRRGGLSACVLH